MTCFVLERLPTIGWWIVLFLRRPVWHWTSFWTGDLSDCFPYAWPTWVPDMRPSRDSELSGNELGMGPYCPACPWVLCGTRQALTLGDLSACSPSAWPTWDTDSEPSRGTTRPSYTRVNQIAGSQQKNTSNKTQGCVAPLETCSPATVSPEDTITPKIQRTRF